MRFVVVVRKITNSPNKYQIKRWKIESTSQQVNEFFGGWTGLGSVDKCWWHRNKKHKKQPFGDASASHLSLVLWHV